MDTMTHATQSDNDQYRAVFADIFSQAITGELIGMQNFASLVEVYDDVEEKMEAVEHSNNERGHAEAFRIEAENLEVEVKVDLNAPYWHRIRLAFLKWAAKKDLTACILIQELMLESFAVSMYYEIGRVARSPMSETFNAIAKEEEGHLNHAIEMLQDEMVKDPSGFAAKVHEIHNDVMTVLAEMVARKDPRGHCGLCHGDCVKESLHHVHLNISDMRGIALNSYLKALDRLGLPGEQTLQWIAKLPA
jgi:fatty aldehyde decarbonylase